MEGLFEELWKAIQFGFRLGMGCHKGASMLKQHVGKRHVYRQLADEHTRANKLDQRRQTKSYAKID